MANLYAYVEGGVAVFRNAADEVFYTVPAGELTIGTDTLGNVLFIHRRDAFAVNAYGTLSNIQPVQFTQALANEVLNKAGVPYTALVDFTAFWDAWILQNSASSVVVEGPTLDDIKTATESTATYTEQTALTAGDILADTNSIAASNSLIQTQTADIKSDTNLIQLNTSNALATLQFAFPQDGSTRFDVFGRSTMVQPETIFDSKQIFDNRPLQWFEQQVSGTVAFTYQPNRASTNLGVSTSTAGVGIRQTARRFNYQTGKAIEFMMTGIMGDFQLGITKRLGAFDDNNGVFFEMSPNAPSGLKVGVRSSVTGVPVDTLVGIDDWDNQTLAGVLDITKTQIFFIEFAWLGVGAVRFGFYIDGKKYVAHTIRYANIGSAVWASTSNFPMRYEIQNDGTGADADLEAICTTVLVYGGRQELGTQFAISRTTGITTNNNADFYPVAAIRLRSTGGAATVRVTGININCTSTASYVWRLLLNPTIVGAALVYTGVTNSAVEGNVVATNTTTITGGTELASGTGSQGSGGTAVDMTNPSDFAIGQRAGGVSDVLVLAVSRIAGTGTTETFHGAINWHEDI